MERTPELISESDVLRQQSAEFLEELRAESLDRISSLEQLVHEINDIMEFEL